MARTKQTARKSTLGMAPRKQLATLNLGIPEIFKPSTGLELGFCFDGTSVDSDTKNISKQPVFDLDNENDVQAHLSNFTVRRQTELLEEGLIDEDEELIDNVVENLKKRYPNSDYVVMFELVDGVPCIAEQDINEHTYSKQWKFLKQMLESGKLSSCDLRGNKETTQFGLVANRRLLPGTPVAVEGGWLLSKEFHDRFCNIDPMLGLASNEIPIEILYPFVNKKVWSNYIRKRWFTCNRGFVVECSTFGNETKFIDDASWLQAGMGTLPKDPNLNSHLVVDLKREMLTVMFFVKEGAIVEKGDELMMDWGCWPEISEKLIPGQVMLSIMRQKDLDNTIEKYGSNFGLMMPKDDDKGLAAIEEVTFNPICLDGLDSSGIDDPRFSILRGIYESSTPRRRKRQFAQKYVSLPAGEVDYKSPEARHAVYPTSTSICNLSRSTRNQLGEITETSIDRSVQKLLNETDLSTRVEVKRINDPYNPALLFSVPNEPTYGVFAKRNFNVDEPVLAYGGILIDDDSKFEDSSYLFDLDTSDLGCTNRLAIHGNKSVGGRINDSRSFGLFRNKCVPNLRTIHHFDGITKTPQIILYASEPIEKGDELLYDYGLDYWKIMWKIMMMQHAAFVAKVSLLTQRIEKEGMKRNVS